MVQLNFNANNVVPAKGFDLMPAGDYLAVIDDSQMVPTKSGTGEMLVLTFQIIDGPFEGRKQWARLNVVNQNPKAEEIAKGELAAICLAVGVPEMQDTAELHSKPLRIRLVHEKRNDTNELVSKIKSYSSCAPVGAGVATTTGPAVKPPAWLAK